MEVFSSQSLKEMPEGMTAFNPDVRDECKASLVKIEWFCLADLWCTAPPQNPSTPPEIWQS